MEEDGRHAVAGGGCSVGIESKSPRVAGAVEGGGFHVLSSFGGESGEGVEVDCDALAVEEVVWRRTDVDLSCRRHGRFSFLVCCLLSLKSLVDFE